MIEIPPKFAGRAPVHPSVKKEASTVARPWKGAEGLAGDVRRYGQWMRDEAEKRIGHLYPKIEITKEMAAERPDLKPLVGQKLTVIAWLWARTVKSQNPAYSHIDVPLASTFVLSSKEGKEAYVEPVIKKDGYEFTVKVGKPPAGAQGGTTAGKRQAFRCLLSNAPIGYDHIRTEGKAGRMQQRLMAIVAESSSGRVYLSPTTDHEKQAASANPTWVPENKLPDNPRDFKTPNYGMSTFGELFTNRQLVALTTFSDLVGEAREHIERDAVAVGMPNDGTSLESGGTGAKAYAEAVITYLGIATSKWTDMSNALCSWNITNQNITHLFNKHAIPMAWDFAELSPFSAVGPWISVVESIFNLFESIPSLTRCLSSQRNASAQTMSRDKFISTDPPYYDNVGYADLSDFFYVWLRRSLREVFPDLLSTISVPKAEELVATPYRHGTKEKAEAFFLDGMTKAMHNLAEQAHPCAPVTIYYAFKQSDSEEIGTNNTGWETFLDAVMKAGFSITGTWPMRTERAARAIGIGTNALASSIVLVCRPRDKSAGTISRRQFQRMLNEALPIALDTMTRESEGMHSPVAPVDLSQAIIGPGMAIFSKYDAVLEADGSPMSVKTALQLINRFLAEDDFDPDTQFCLHWFEQHGWETAKFGEADTLARAKGTSVDGVKQAGVIEAGGGNVRLYRWKEYPTDWDPTKDFRLPVWEALHHLIRVYTAEGYSGAAQVLKAIGDKAEPTRQLAYRLYTLCERKGWAEDARSYNELVTGWKGIEAALSSAPTAKTETLF
jgi:putative DNA methylase